MENKKGKKQSSQGGSPAGGKISDIFFGKADKMLENIRLFLRFKKHSKIIEREEKAIENVRLKLAKLYGGPSASLREAFRAGEIINRGMADVDLNKPEIAENKKQAVEAIEIESRDKNIQYEKTIGAAPGEIVAEVSSENKAAIKQDELIFIPLSEIAKNSNYSKNYINFSARQGKLRAKKIGGVWHTTETWLEEFTRVSQAKKNKFKEKLSHDLGGNKKFAEVGDGGPTSTPEVEPPKGEKRVTGVFAKKYFTVVFEFLRFSLKKVKRWFSELGEMEGARELAKLRKAKLADFWKFDYAKPAMALIALVLLMAIGNITKADLANLGDQGKKKIYFAYNAGVDAATKIISHVNGEAGKQIAKVRIGKENFVKIAEDIFRRDKIKEFEKNTSLSLKGDEKAAFAEATASQGGAVLGEATSESSTFGTPKVELSGNGKVLAAATGAGQTNVGDIEVSAYLMDGENKEIPNGEYDVRFGIYTTDRAEQDPYPSDADKGSRVWEETQKVTVENGLLKTYLGATTPIPASFNFAAQNYYIGIRIAEDAEMAPRKRIGAVPLARTAMTISGQAIGNGAGNIPLSNGTLNTNLNADLLDGQHASAFQPAGSYLTSAPDEYLPWKLQSSAADAGQKIKSNKGAIFAGSNGIVTSRNLSTLTIALDETLSPTLTGLTLSGLSPYGVIYGNAAGALQSVVAGTEGQVLTFHVGAAPTWDISPPAAAEYVTLALDAALTNERVLTGTANQVIITDGGANGSVTLSLPQSISATSAPTFATLNLTTLDLGVNTITDGNMTGSWNFNAGNLSGIGTIDTGQGANELYAMNQNVRTADSPSFTGLTVSGLTPNYPVIATLGGALATEQYLDVTRGGTGVGTFAQYGVLYGNLAADIQVTAAGTNGQIFTAHTGAAPTWENTAPAAAHAILSAQHSDTTPAAVQRGDLMTGQGVASTWTRLAKGGANTYLYSDGTDISWLGITLGTNTTGNYVSSLTGTADQITASAATGNITLSLPQSINTTNSPSFAGLTVSGLTPNYPVITTLGGQLTTEQYLDVARGGTGVGTFTQYGVLYGNLAADLLVTAAGTEGQVLMAHAGSAPTWSSTAPAAAHALLSVQHSDATAASVQRGDLMTGQGAAPTTWTRLGKGGANTYLRSDGTDLSWSAITLGTNTTGNYVATAIGTADQVIVSGATGNVTFSLPQSINTTSSPTFATLNLTTLDLGTNTITDGNFNGGWSFNAGALTGIASIDTITTSSTALTFTSTAPTISVSTAATAINLDAGTTGEVNIAGTSTGNVNIAGGSGVGMGCTIDNTTGDLVCSGDITGGGTGTIGYWTRTGTVLSPQTAGDTVAVYANGLNTSGTLLGVSYTANATLTGELIGAKIDLNDGHVTPLNQNVTGVRVVLPTTTNTNGAGTITYNGMSLGYGVGTGINQNGAGATVYNGANLLMPALTQTLGSLTANGVLVTTSSSITTGGTANAMNITATGVGAGSLNGVYISAITGSTGTERAIAVGSGWDAALTVNGNTVINGSGVVPATAGGTGLTSYAAGDIIYANTTTSFTNLAAGVPNNGKVLVVTAGVPTWGVMSGSACTDCVINDPTAVATQTITPAADISSLIIREATGGLTSGNIFEVGPAGTPYFYIDKDGNVSTGGTASETLTLTPLSNTTALTLVGTNVTTASLQYINSKNTQGTIFNIAYGGPGATTLAGALIGAKIDLSTNVTATNQSATGISVILPTPTNSSGTVNYKGLAITGTVGGGLNQETAGTTVFSGVDVTIPALTQTAGSLTANGVLVTTPATITTGGTASGLNIAATGVGAGTLYGLNVSNLAGGAGAGAETAIHTGTGWDYAAIFEAGNIGIGTTTPGAKLDIIGGSVRTDNQFISTLAIGTAPLVVTSTTAVTNLNADLLDGQHGAYYAPIASPTFTGTVTIPSPFTLGATSVTTTGTQLNYLNAATGMTGTTSTNLVFSTSPTLVTPVLGTPTSVTLTNADGTAASLTAGHVTNATFTTALTVNTGTLTLTADASNTSVLTVGAGAVSVSGSNTGDNAANSSTMYIGTTAHALNRASAPEGLSGITGLTPGADFTLNQNSVAAFTSVEAGAIVNTLYLKAGLVGIGTTTPGAKLQVNQSGTVTAANYGASIYNAAISSTDSINKYGLYVSSTGTWNGLGATNYGLYVAAPTGGTANTTALFAGSLGNVSVDGTGAILAFSRGGANYIEAANVAGTLGFQTGGANTQMTIDAAGNVGIGTTTPTGAKLQVAGGGIKVSGASEINDTLSLFSASSSWLILGSSGGAGQYGYLSWDDTNKAISMVGTQGSAASMTWKNANVGIGTTTPARALHIQRADAWGGGMQLTNTGSGGESYSLLVGSTADGLAGKFGIYDENEDWRLVIDTNGNVGIGTTTPGSLLQIGAGGTSSTTTAGIYVKNTFSNADAIDAGVAIEPLWNAANSVFPTSLYIRGRIGVSVAQTDVYAAYIDAMTQGAGASVTNAYGLYIANPTIGGTKNVAAAIMGNVGIGTTNPGALLHINSTAALSASGQEVLRLAADYNWLTPGSGPKLTFYYGAGAQETGYIKSVARAGSTMDLEFGTGFSTLNTKMTITEGGNVGIGTTTPGYVLDEYNSSHLALRLTRATNVNTSAVLLDLALLNSSNAITNYGEIRGNIISNTAGAEAGALTFSTMKAGTVTEQMRIDNNGNVGIGTTNPGAKLNVISTDNAWTIATLFGTSLTQAAATGTSVSGNISSISFSPTYSTAITTPAISGNVLNVARSSTTNTDFASTLTVSGAVAYFADTATQTQGTLTSTADVVQIIQNYGANSGAALNITSAGSYIFRANDNGTFTDTTPFVIDGGGNVGIGLTTPNELLTVSGRISLAETTAPSDTAGWGKIFVKSADSLLYFQSDGGVEYNLTAASLWAKTGNNLSPAAAGDDLYLGANELLGVGYDPSTFAAGAVAAFNGNVGIGTTSPGAKLQVAAASDSMALTVSNGSLNPFILYQNTVSDGNAEAVTNAVLSVGTRGGNSAIFRGNVGIGTTSPLAKLQVASGYIRMGTASDGMLLAYSSGLTEVVGIDTGDNGWNDVALRTGADNSIGLMVKTSGNVGIGTTAPGATLHVFKRDDTGASAGQPETRIEHQDIRAIGQGGTNGGKLNFYNIQRDNTGWAADSIWGEIGFYPSQPTAGTAQVGAKILAAADGAIGGGNTSSYLSFQTTSGTTLSEKMRILSGGNVGIGTTAPAAKLDVVDTAASGLGSFNLSSNGGSGYAAQLSFLNTANNAAGDGVGGKRVALIEIQNVAGSAGQTGANINLYTHQANGSLIQPMILMGNGNVIMNAGNVGIGTTTPNQKLEVNGRIRMATWTADGNTAVYYNSATGDIGVNSSDVRLKKNIAAIPNALAIIQGITGVTYNLKTDPAGAQKTVGVLAQDVAAAMPELTFPITGPDGKEYLSVHYDKLAPVLIEGIKQQQTQISGINTQVGDLNLRTNQNIETVSELQNSVDQNLVVISNNFATLNSQVSTLNSGIQKNTSDISALQTRTSSLEQNTADISRNLTELTATVGTMSETESMIVSRLTDHETRIAALEAATLSGTTGVSGSLELPPALKKFDASLTAILGSDGKNIFTLNGEFDAKVLGAQSLKLGSQTSGSGKIKSGDAEVVIPALEVKSDSKIYVTPTDSSFGKVIYAKKEDIVSGESFKVKFDGASVEKDIPFNWLIVN